MNENGRNKKDLLTKAFDAAVSGAVEAWQDFKNVAVFSWKDSKSDSMKRAKLLTLVPFSPLVVATAVFSGSLAATTDAVIDHYLDKKYQPGPKR